MNQKEENSYQNGDEKPMCAVVGPPDITLTRQVLDDLIEQYSHPFIGFTMQPSEFYRAERDNKITDNWGTRQVVPNYMIVNQPCPIVKWTSQRVMMRYVARKTNKNLLIKPLNTPSPMSAISEKVENFSESETILPDYRLERTFVLASHARGSKQKIISADQRAESIERVTEQAHNRRLKRKRKGN